ncbi:MAG: UDP-N-acetylmuramoyl-tripeptide--D-alanyl-D-alanine ligase [Porticoccaceae bacterium]
MIGTIRLTDAAARFGGTLYNGPSHLLSNEESNKEPSTIDTEFNSVSIDSRKIGQGDLFVALVGERLDAHNYLDQVVGKAGAAVVSTLNKQLPLVQWVVEDTTVALGQLAQLQREKFTGTVVAVTGSTGKTSVKELIASILGQLGSVHFTRGNFNNHIGVPLTLLAMESDGDFAVIEMGASAGGEISYLCSIAQPHIALINNVQLAHIEGFGSIEGVAAAKGEIYSGLQASGTAALNFDEPWTDQWRDLIAERACISFSLSNPNADISAADIEVLENGCCRFRLKTALGTQAVTLNIPGRHSVNNALAAAACAVAAGASLDQIVAGLQLGTSPDRRLQVKNLPGGAVVIDDSYNASPSSMCAAIDVLAASAGRKILVLGDMAELGADKQELHRQVGDYAKNAGIDQLFTLGRLSALISQAFGDGKHFEDFDLLKESLCREVFGEDGKRSDLTVLVKGSRSSQMDLVVDMLLAEKS